MAIIQRSINNIAGLQTSLDSINGDISGLGSRVSALENATTQSATAPGVAYPGDTWYDTVNNIFNVYREYPVGSGIFIWQPIILNNDGSLDCGSF